MTVEIGPHRFDMRPDDAGLGLLLTAAGRPAIRILVDEPALRDAGDGRLLDTTRAFLERFLEREEAALEAARHVTAAQLWHEYAGSWREAGDTDLGDVGAFAEALGPGELSLFVERDGTVTMAELHWANTDLFLGHNVVTQVHDPDAWRTFDATLFG